MSNDWVTELHTKGFTRFFRPDLVDLVDGDFLLVHTEEMLRDNFKEDLPSHVNAQLTIIANVLQMDYMNQGFDHNQFVKYIFWEGVDADSGAWHNDGFEGMNYFFLLYFDNMAESTGGAVHFKYGQNEETFFPQRGDLFLLNQNSGFFHRAEKASITRRQASFDFLV